MDVDQTCGDYRSVFGVGDQEVCKVEAGMHVVADQPRWDVVERIDGVDRYDPANGRRYRNGTTYTGSAVVRMEVY